LLALDLRLRGAAVLFVRLVLFDAVFRVAADRLVVRLDVLFLELLLAGIGRTYAVSGLNQAENISFQASGGWQPASSIRRIMLCIILGMTRGASKARMAKEIPKPATTPNSDVKKILRVVNMTKL